MKPALRPLKRGLCAGFSLTRRGHRTNHIEIVISTRKFWLNDRF
jgi:hypothetical protein